MREWGENENAKSSTIENTSGQGDLGTLSTQHDESTANTLGSEKDSTDDYNVTDTVTNKIPSSTRTTTIEIEEGSINGNISTLQTSTIPTYIILVSMGALNKNHISMFSCESSSFVLRVVVGF